MAKTSLISAGASVSAKGKRTRSQNKRSDNVNVDDRAVKGKKPLVQEKEVPYGSVDGLLAGRLAVGRLRESPRARVDKYYYEPGPYGRVFRSYISVERYVGKQSAKQQKGTSSTASTSGRRSTRTRQYSSSLFGKLWLNIENDGVSVSSTSTAAPNINGIPATTAGKRATRSRQCSSPIFDMPWLNIEKDGVNVSSTSIAAPNTYGTETSSTRKGRGRRNKQGKPFGRDQMFYEVLEDFPHGWYREGRARRNSPKIIDWHYYGPGITRRFRSKVAAREFLEQRQQEAVLYGTSTSTSTTVSSQNTQGSWRGLNIDLNKTPEENHLDFVEI